MALGVGGVAVLAADPFPLAAYASVGIAVRREAEGAPISLLFNHRAGTAARHRLDQRIDGHKLGELV